LSPKPCSYLYVTLEFKLRPDGECGGVLAKRVDEVYLGKSVSDVVQKLLDPEADEYNQAYNAQDRSISQQIQTRFEMALIPHSCKVHFIARTNDGRELEMELTDRLSDYAALIIKTEEEEISGQKTPYNLIELVVD